MKKNQKGFTMAELLIVVAIIAVMVAIAIPTFTEQLERSREGVDLANLRNGYTEAKLAMMTGDKTAKFFVYQFKVKQETANWTVDTSKFPNNTVISVSTINIVKGTANVTGAIISASDATDGTFTASPADNDKVATFVYIFDRTNNEISAIHFLNSAYKDSTLTEDDKGIDGAGHSFTVSAAKAVEKTTA